MSTDKPSSGDVVDTRRAIVQMRGVGLNVAADPRAALNDGDVYSSALVWESVAHSEKFTELEARMKKIEERLDALPDLPKLPFPQA